VKKKKKEKENKAKKKKLDSIPPPVLSGDVARVRKFRDVCCTRKLRISARAS
jgi:hypothetical protein